MASVKVEMSMSLDSFVAGPNQRVERPLGEGGERLHEWIVGLASWRESHGLSGGTRNADDDVVRESLGATGAVVMGRRMFSGGAGPSIDAAVAQARTAAGDKSVVVAGGANVVQQCLRAGLLDEIQIHLVPALLGDGVRLFDDLSADQAELAVACVDSPAVTHLRYRVAS